jgi:hypothetical protein
VINENEQGDLKKDKMNRSSLFFNTRNFPVSETEREGGSDRETDTTKNKFSKIYVSHQKVSVSAFFRARFVQILYWRCMLPHAEL